MQARMNSHTPACSCSNRASCGIGMRPTRAPVCFYNGAQVEISFCGSGMGLAAWSPLRPQDPTWSWYGAMMWTRMICVCGWLPEYIELPRWAFLLGDPLQAVSHSVAVR